MIGRSVCRILARNLEGVLALLDSGKPPTTTDGRRLLTWAERNLRRYRASREVRHGHTRVTDTDYVNQRGELGANLCNSSTVVRSK